MISFSRQAEDYYNSSIYIAAVCVSEDKSNIQNMCSYRSRIVHTVQAQQREQSSVYYTQYNIAHMNDIIIYRRGEYPHIITHTHSSMLLSVEVV